jgi:hypothetical protein
MSWVAENVGGSLRASGASITPRACATMDVARSACSVIAFSEIGWVAEGPWCGRIHAFLAVRYDNERNST